ncbi:MAG: glucokinase [Burkholderiales bacterium]|nr:glucokinase [Burkholderiales bacterium]
MSDVAAGEGFGLLADIGGTNVRFALVAPGSSEPEQAISYRGADFVGFEQAVRAYLQATGQPQVRRAAIDVATAITGDLVRLTNSPWAFSIEQTRRQFGFERLLVLNDFAALARSLPTLPPEDLRQVGRGRCEPRRAKALIGPGTGLGVSGLVPCGEGWTALEGEGGHTAFSPMTEREDAVLSVLREGYGHVSTERLASGPGLVNLYEALCRLDHEVPRGLEPGQISEVGMAGSDRHCVEALEMFCAVLGTAAANLAVTLGARGGLYIGGGIVPRLGEWFDTSPFRRRFEHKGRFSSYLAAVATLVITAENPALRGLAAALAGDG